MFLGIDPLYWLLMLPVLLISMVASFRVKYNFDKYAKVHLQRGLTGAEIAKTILRTNGLNDVRVLKSEGFLTDFYDPKEKVIKLSPAVYDNPSVAAAGVAAHETGHALQHATAYAPLAIRNMLVPVASIGSNLAWIIILLGFVIGFLGLVKIGIVLFTIVVIFQLITLPVEFNASTRAKKILVQTGLTSSEEYEGVSHVLSAAAMTYVAAAASAIVTLLYFLIRAGIIGRRD